MFQCGEAVRDACLDPPRIARSLVAQHIAAAHHSVSDVGPLRRRRHEQIVRA